MNSSTLVGANFNDTRNLGPVLEGEGKYLQFLGKPGKQNTVINHNKVKKRMIKIVLACIL